MDMINMSAKGVPAGFEIQRKVARPVECDCGNSVMWRCKGFIKIWVCCNCGKRYFHNARSLERRIGKGMLQSCEVITKQQINGYLEKDFLSEIG